MNLAATSATKYSLRPVFNMRKDFVAEIRSSASRAFARDKIRTLFFHALAVLIPRVDARQCRFFVNAFRQPGNTDGTYQSIVDRERHATADEVNFAGVHVHDAEVAIGTGFAELGGSFGAVAQ